jgi:hypothetical protein
MEKDAAADRLSAARKLSFVLARARALFHKNTVKEVKLFSLHSFFMYFKTFSLIIV